MIARLRSPLWLDAGLPVALGIVLQLELWLGETYQGHSIFPGDHAVRAVFLVAICVAQIWRRRVPLRVYAMTMGLIAVSSILEGASEAGGLYFVFVIATYSAAAWSPRWPVAAAIGLASGVVQAVTDPLVHSVLDVLYGGIFLAAGFGLGRIVFVRGWRADTAERRATLAERARLAREMHDVIAHSVSVMVMQAKGGAAVLDTDPERAREALATIERNGRQAVDELRRMLDLMDSGEPRGDRHPQPGLDALPTLLDDTRAAGLAVDYAVEGQAGRLSPVAELSAYRIVQESLTNVRKHAGDATAAVTLRWSPEALELSVSDDGSQAAAGAGARRGLIGMRERAAVLGGTLDAGARPEGGYRVRAVLPRR